MTATQLDRKLPIWLRPQAVYLIIAGFTVLRMMIAASTGLVRDEGYYTLWSTVPMPGYLDHPPMVAWMIAAGRTLVGESEAGVRLLPVLAIAVTSLAVYRTGILLLGARIAAIAVIWFNVTVAAGLLFIATPDTPLVMFWALSLWAVAEFVASRNANWWLAAGSFAGLALLSKYSAAFLGIGLLLYIVASRARWPWLRVWQVWAGAALALLVFSPNVIWNAQNEWAGMLFQASRRLGTLGIDFRALSVNLLELLAGQALATGIILFAFVIAAIVAFAVRSDARREDGLALPILTALPLVLYFLGYAARYRVEANWLLPIWPMLSLAGAWAVVRLRPANPIADWPVMALRWLHVPLNVALVGIVYAQALWQPLDLPRLLDRTSDMRGWAGVEEQITEVAGANGARLVTTAGDYGTAGEMVAYNLFAETGLTVRPLESRARWRFLPPVDAALLEGTSILVHPGETDRERALQFFAEVEPAGEALRMQGDKVLERFAIYVVSEPQARTRDVLLNP